jgi:hypothetical protein
MTRGKIILVLGGGMGGAVAATRLRSCFRANTGSFWWNGSPGTFSHRRFSG